MDVMDQEAAKHGTNMSLGPFGFAASSGSDMTDEGHDVKIFARRYPFDLTKKEMSTTDALEMRKNLQ